MREQSRRPSKSVSRWICVYAMLSVCFNSRRAAKSAHPDKGGSEAKMAALNEAYEVLSNPELRARFDAGEDPNDPMAAQGGSGFGGATHNFHGFQGSGFGGQHPFAQFFQGAAGGGGGQFKFHFG